MKLSLKKSQSLSHLRYPMDTHQLTSSQGEADGVFEREYEVASIGGVNLPCGWYRVKGSLPSTGGRDHTHTHTPRILIILIKKHHGSLKCTLDANSNSPLEWDQNLGKSRPLKSFLCIIQSGRN
jgi:hypothetical protein